MEVISNMAEEVKFTEDEMTQINELQREYVNIQNAFGQLSVNRIRLNQQIEELDGAEDNLQKDFVNAQTKEKEFIDQINKKYGDGNLDINTGIFTPSENSKEETSKLPSTTTRLSFVKFVVVRSINVLF